MDQDVAKWTAIVVGGGGLSGILTSLLTLAQAKKSWQADMEARMKRLEGQSPDALLRRVERFDESRAEDRREIKSDIDSLKTHIREALEALLRIQQRLGMPSV